MAGLDLKVTKAFLPKPLFIIGMFRMNLLGIITWIHENLPFVDASLLIEGIFGPFKVFIDTEQFFDCWMLCGSISDDSQLFDVSAGSILEVSVD